MSWSIELHKNKSGDVPVKVCSLFPDKQVDGSIEFRPCRSGSEWIAVKLAYECNDGSIDLCRVNYSIQHGSYKFKHPVMVELVRDKWGRVDNPLNPTTKETPNDVSLGKDPANVIKYITQVTKNQDLARTVVALIQQCYAEYQQQQLQAA